MAKGKNITWEHLTTDQVDRNRPGIVWMPPNSVEWYEALGEYVEARKDNQTKFYIHYTETPARAKLLAEIYKSIKKDRKPMDMNQLAKSIVELSTSNHEEEPPDLTNKEIAGYQGGIARKNKTTKKQRTEIAQKGANKRWDK